MAKRYTDTGKWGKRWLRELSPEMKLFWFYLLDNCDHAGIWDVDIELAGFQIGLQLDGDEILDIFKNRIEVTKNGKWFVPKFIEFQYGELNESNKVHKSVIHKLEKVGAWGFPQGACEGLPRPYDEAKDKDKDKDMDKDKELKDKEQKISVKESFEYFWEAYPEKIGKKSAFESYKKCGQTNDVLLGAIERQKYSDKWRNGYIPNPTTWLNQGRWDDEPAIRKSKTRLKMEETMAWTPHEVTA
jgi:hypothetical protein